jgi:hypothetical protein
MPTFPASLSSLASSPVSLPPAQSHTACFYNWIARLTLAYTDMLSGPICAMVWEGRDAVKTGRGTYHCNKDKNAHTYIT